MVYLRYKPSFLESNIGHTVRNLARSERNPEVRIRRYFAARAEKKKAEEEKKKNKKKNGAGDDDDDEEEDDDDEVGAEVQACWR